MYFFVDRVAEPLSNRLVKVAKGSPGFRAVCTGLANWHNSAEHNAAQRRSAARRDETDGPEPEGAQATAAPKLSEREATELGCDLLGEGIVWTIGLAVLYHEMRRDWENETQQEAVMASNLLRIEALEKRLGRLEGQAPPPQAAPAPPPPGWWGRLSASLGGQREGPQPT